MKAIKSLKFCFVIVMFLISGCVLITADDIKKSHPESLGTSYTNLQARYQDSDTGVSIFTYNVEKNFSLQDLRQQIVSKQYANRPTFKVTKDEVVEGSTAELILRQEITSSGPEGFNEYRILYNKDKKLVTVMYANLDSEVERSNYENFVKKQNSIHEEN